ncbi:hypothetical protein NECAME_12795 [Necator americanus]|uniref:Uncharacterized protein n=1 Tax=Necator americanus TaxID=51031 RepID=W2T0C8_NECAM|nr:hypothetical protein NECAME_12795 [Necator americanus]ETN74706.1 hypothetical protein NECAME_12795 [Necator americanus]
MREPQVVPKHAVIDPAALPCEFDYQCRMGESCSGVIALVDRNVTVCQYDVAKEDRGEKCVNIAEEKKEKIFKILSKLSDNDHLMT